MNGSGSRSGRAGGEFALLARLAPFLADSGQGLVVAAGDDAAVLDIGGQGVCLAVDVLVEDVHFRRDVSGLDDIGWKAIAVNCSDIAAMGGRPSDAVVGLCYPAGMPAADVEMVYRGMDEACRRWGLRLVGGDTVNAPALLLSVTVLGHVDLERVTRRSGARPDDVVLVAGTLGGAAAALAQVGAGVEPDPALLAAHRRPSAQVEAGTRLAAAGATAMIDVSDGLGADLGHLCRASDVSARLQGALLPVATGVSDAARQAGVDMWDLLSGGGDDYALVATVPADLAEHAAAATGATMVGVVEPGPPAVMLETADGSRGDISRHGFEHTA